MHHLSFVHYIACFYFLWGCLAPHVNVLFDVSISGEFHCFSDGPCSIWGWTWGAFIFSRATSSWHAKCASSGRAKIWICWRRLSSSSWYRGVHLIDTLLYNAFSSYCRLLNCKSSKMLDTLWDQNTHVALAFEVPGGWLKEKEAVDLTVLQVLPYNLGFFNDFLFLDLLSPISVSLFWKAVSSDTAAGFQCICHHSRFPTTILSFSCHAWTGITFPFLCIILKMLMGGGGSFSAGGPGKGMHSRLCMFCRFFDSWLTSCSLACFLKFFSCFFFHAFSDLRVLNKHQRLESFSAFNNLFNNTGVFGLYASTVRHALQISINTIVFAFSRLDILQLAI